MMIKSLYRHYDIIHIENISSVSVRYNFPHKNLPQFRKEHLIRLSCIECISSILQYTEMLTVNSKILNSHSRTETGSLNRNAKRSHFFTRIPVIIAYTRISPCIDSLMIALHTTSACGSISSVTEVAITSAS